MSIKFESNIKNITAIITISIFLILAAITGMTSFFTVEEQEKAVVTTFGRADTSAVYDAGLHFKIPFVQNVQIVNITTQGMTLGYRSTGGKDTTYSDESLMITRDFNFVTIDFYVEWKVNDPIKYLYSSQDPQNLLRNIVQSSARSVVSGFDVDEVLTTAKSEIQAKVKDNVSEKLLQYDIGITISNITVQDAEPPTDEISLAFKDVENAKQEKQTEINKARQYENTQIPYARSEADRVIKEAESQKQSRINEAEGQVSRFNEMYNEYRNNQEVTKTRMYLEAMEEILPGVKVVIEESSDSTLKLIDLN